MRARIVVLLGALLALSTCVSGCAAHGQVTTGTPHAPATAGPAPGSATSPPFGSGDPLRNDCTELVGADVLARLDRALTAGGDALVANDSASQEALALKGTVCAWTDESAAVSLVVTAAKPDAATFAALKQRASAGSSDPEFGGTVAAYVRDDKVELFTRGGYWATAMSSLLSDPAAVTLLGQRLLDALPAG